MPNTELLTFTDVGNRDVYNPTVLKIDGELVLAGRVESRDYPSDAYTAPTETRFFTEVRKGVFTPLRDTPVFRLEDPSLMWIGDEIIMGGVEVEWTPNGKHEWFGVRFNGYWMRFYRGRSLKDLEPFAVGPKDMKDIRLVDLGERGVGIFTRPQGKEFGMGRIGWTTLRSLDELSPERIEDAHIFHNQFSKNSHGGVNAAYPLTDGTIGVLLHKARVAGTMRHYEAATAVFDPDMLEWSPLRTIARRSDFPEAPAKRPELTDVVFPGALLRENADTWTLYAGLSDAATGRRTIENPFDA